MTVAAADIAPYVDLALAGVHREYPSKISHVLTGDADVRPPRELTPAFFGCFDWHSAVHAHWTLARAARLFPSASFASQAREVLANSLTPQKLAGEVEYLQAPGRGAFELPYGMAWVLSLAAELAIWGEADATYWQGALAPLEKIAAQRLVNWVGGLPRPIRVGEHGQSAFAMTLLFDWAHARGQMDVARAVAVRALTLHRGDRDLPIRFEPSAHDFLSPSLATADLVRRALDAKKFGVWLKSALPSIPYAGGPWLQPVISPDPTDGRLVHLDGLSLSRAWMLEGISSALPERDPRRASLDRSAEQHRTVGLAAAQTEHWMGAHWLGTFAVYLLTGGSVATPMSLAS